MGHLWRMWWVADMCGCTATGAGRVWWLRHSMVLGCMRVCAWEADSSATTTACVVVCKGVHREGGEHDGVWSGGGEGVGGA